MIRLKLTGIRYSRLVVNRFSGMAPDGRSLWECRCDCGNIVIVRSNNLKGGQVRSCGCLLKENSRTHGKKGSREYSSWSAMMKRCNCVTDPAYENYGGRGIKVCERWYKFENFFADMGDRPIGMCIERKLNDVGYWPENCRWATMKEQARNRRNTIYIDFNGETRSLAEWAEITMISYQTLIWRVKNGFSVERLFSKPIKAV